MNTAFKYFKKYWYGVLVSFIILLGVFLRLKGLLINPSMWHDECGLAWNIKFKSYLELFGHLRFLQVAPPLFLVATKFLVNIFNASNSVLASDLTMRLIPFVCGVLSIGVFYLISKELFQSRRATLAALLLFAINTVLIHYSFEFKQYGPDMFCVLLLIMFFIKLNLAEISYKKLIASSVGIAALIWFSFVSGFVSAAGIINLILNRQTKENNVKKILIFCFLIFISVLAYLKFYILGTYHDNGAGMSEFWSKEFILPNFSNFFYLFTENIRYFFSSVKHILFILILLPYGTFIYFKEKKYEFINVALLTFVFLITASVLHIYPFSKRLIIFLVPIFILLIAKPLDNVNFRAERAKKLKSAIILIMMFFVLFPQFQNTILELKNQNINKGEFPREMMGYIMKNIKPQDTIFFNKGSSNEFFYYSSFYNIENKFPNKFIYENISSTPNEKYFEFLNALPPGNYWFFLPYDYSPQRVMINYIKNWAEVNTKIIYIKEATQSALIYTHIK